MTAKEPTGVVWSAEFVNVPESYQQNLWKTLCKIMLSRLKSLAHACGNSRLHTK